jgi:hypothetical protein
MSRRSNVNPDHYKVAGRLMPDDLARERRKQADPLFGATRGRRSKPMPPWLRANQSASPSPETHDAGETVSVNASDDSDVAAQQPQAKPRPNARGKQGAGGSNERKTARRQAEQRKHDTSTGTARGARSASAKRRSTPKASGARGTPAGNKAPRARGSAARAASPERAGRPAARKTKSRGAQKATAKKGTRAAAKKRSLPAKKKKTR